MTASEQLVGLLGVELRPSTIKSLSFRLDVAERSEAVLVWIRGKQSSMTQARLALRKVTRTEGVPPLKMLKARSTQTNESLQRDQELSRGSSLDQAFAIAMAPEVASYARRCCPV
jgi:hypothetical protein